MSWTYSGSPFFYPATQQTLIDSVRFLISDTNSSSPLLQDGEINGLLLQNSSDPSGGPNTIYNVYAAAIQGVIALVAKYSLLANKSVGDLSLQYGDIAKNLQSLIGLLRKQGTRQNAPIPYAGGISLGDMEIDQSDDDINQPSFTIGMDDNPDETPSLLTGMTAFSQAVPAG